MTMVNALMSLFNNKATELFRDPLSLFGTNFLSSGFNSAGLSFLGPDLTLQNLTNFSGSFSILNLISGALQNSGLTGRNTPDQESPSPFNNTGTGALKALTDIIFLPDSKEGEGNSQTSAIDNPLEILTLFAGLKGGSLFSKFAHVAKGLGTTQDHDPHKDIVTARLGQTSYADIAKSLGINDPQAIKRFADKLRRLNPFNAAPNPGEQINIPAYVL